MRAVKHAVPQIIGDLLKAEIAEKAARSIKYQITIAKLPPAKELAEFDFAGMPIDEGLVRDLARGDFLAQQRNVVLVGSRGPKTLWSTAASFSCSVGTTQQAVVFGDVVLLAVLFENATDIDRCRSWARFRGQDNA